MFEVPQPHQTNAMFRTTLLSVLLASPALAHFPWLYTTEDCHPRLFFGEDLTDRDYKLPEAVAGAEVWQAAIDAPEKLIKLEAVEEEGFIGLQGIDPIEPRGRLQTSILYGVYHGAKLCYDSQHLPAEQPARWPTEPDADATLQALLRVADGKLRATVLLKGQPLAGAQVTLSHESGEGGAGVSTDRAGSASFPIEAVKPGLNALLVMHVDPTQSGEVGGKPFKSATHILTATFNFAADQPAADNAFPPLPEAVSSFGGAACDGWLYVYSGHIGQAHDHSRDNLSKHFRRIRLDGSGVWEELPIEEPLQGLALVAHRGALYRVGGLDARNAAGDAEDLHSVGTFARYDPGTRTWTNLPPLPEPRSSHNAVMMDGTLYVIGGWTLTGPKGGAWRSGALAFDLESPGAGWKQLPEPPHKRRALAVSHVDGQIVALCGMNDSGEPTSSVDYFDPQGKKWTAGPSFPGTPFEGFGLSAWNLDGKLYAGGMEGNLYQLNADRSAWTKVAKLATNRFFHQLVPDGAGGLLAVAGVSPESGHTPAVEPIKLGP